MRLFSGAGWVYIVRQRKHSTMTQDNTSTLAALSAELAGVVARVGPSVVRVDDGSRLTATGVLWSDDGVVLTTSHGVERDDDLAIELASGTRLPATLVGRDPETDLAVLRVPAGGLTPIAKANPEAVQVGQLVLALGRPGESGLSATLGIISARQDAQDGGRPEYILHTDATLYPGFSGGPLVNVQGEVVGLTNLGFGRGMGLALGLPILTHVAEALLAGGAVKRGYLGVSAQSVPLPPSLQTSLGLTQARGLLVVQVESGGPADAAGLLLGDMLLGLGGTALDDVDDLRRPLRGLAAGQAVTLNLARGGAAHDLAVTLGARE